MVIDSPNILRIENLTTDGVVVVSGGNGTLGSTGTPSLTSVTLSGLTDTRVPFVSTHTLIDHASMTFDTTNGLKLAAGSASALNLTSITGAVEGGILFGTDTNLYRSTTAILASEYSVNYLSGPTYTFRKSRGSSSVKIVVNASDTTGNVTFQGWDGAAWQDNASITATVDGTPGAGAMPGRLNFYTVPSSSTTLTSAGYINSSQNWLIGTSPTATATKLMVTGSIGINRNSTINTSILSDHDCYIYSTLSTGTVYPFGGLGHLVIQPRTSASNSVLIATRSSSTKNRYLQIDANSSVNALMVQPEAPTATPNITGGTMADGDYYYVIVAVDYLGTMTGAGTESTVATISGGGGSGSVSLSWSAVTGTAYYKIFRTSVSGTYAGSCRVATSIKETTFIDIGTALQADVPSVNNFGMIASWNASTSNNLTPNSITQTVAGKAYTTILATPAAPTCTPSASGGAIADGTYYYILTAGDANGVYTQRGTESTATIVTGGGGAGSVALSWGPVQGAYSYRIHRTTVPGDYSTSASLVATITPKIAGITWSATAITFTDIIATGSLTATSPPTVASATASNWASTGAGCFGGTQFYIRSVQNSSSNGAIVLEPIISHTSNNNCLNSSPIYTVTSSASSRNNINLAVTIGQSAALTNGLKEIRFADISVIAGASLDTHYGCYFESWTNATNNYPIYFVGTGIKNGINWGTASGNLYSGGTGTLATQYSAGSATGPTFALLKSRGTTASPTTVSAADTVGTLAFQAHDGSGFINAASIVASVDGTPGTNDMPGSLLFKTTPDGSTTLTSALKLDAAQNATFYGTVQVYPATNQLVLGGVSSGRTVTITAPQPATASRTHTIPDIAADGTFAFLQGTQTFAGAKTFTLDATFSANIIGALATVFYFGPSGTDGSWLLKESGGSMLLQKRVGGSWVTKASWA